MFKALGRVAAGTILFLLGGILASWAYSHNEQQRQSYLDAWQSTIASGVDRLYLLEDLQSTDVFIAQLEDFSNTTELREAFERHKLDVRLMDRAERTFLVFFGPHSCPNGDLVPILDPALMSLHLKRIGRLPPHLEICDIDQDGWPAVKLMGHNHRVLATNASLECIILEQRSPLMRRDQQP